MKCPSCDADNPDDAQFCNLCLTAFRPAGGPQEGAGPDQAGDPRAFGDSTTAGPSGPPSAYPVGPPPAGPGVSPSDAFGGLQTTMPDGAATAPQAGRWGPKAKMGSAIFVVVAIVSGALGYFLMGKLLNRPTTYTSAKSALSFEYPGGWKETSIQVPGFGQAFAVPGVEMNTEVALEGGEGAVGYALWAGSIKGLTPQQWAEAKNNLATSDMSDLATATGGTITSGPNVKSFTIAGADAIQLEVVAKKGAETVRLYLAVAYQGDTAYMFVFAGDDTSETVSQWKDIMQSVKLKK